MARIVVDGIPYVYGLFNDNATTIGTYNIDVTNASFFQSAYCVTGNYNGVSLDPYINNGNVSLTYDPANTYGKLTITTGNVQSSMTVTYNLRQQVWGFSLSQNNSLNSGRTLVNGSDLYIGNSSNGLIQLGTKADFDQCFQSVSEGKSIVAAAVTDKGVQTAADSTFQQIADNIEAISQLDTSDANATASQILSGYSAYVNGSKVTGSMTNRGAVTSSLNCGNSYTIPEGYHNGTGKVTANTLASQTSATAVAADILTGKTAYVNGNRLTGTMANRGAASQALNCGGSYTIPAGYHNGSGRVTANSLASQTAGTATAAQIFSGYTAWVNGTRLTGTASGAKTNARVTRTSSYSGNLGSRIGSFNGTTLRVTLTTTEGNLAVVESGDYIEIELS